MKLVPPRSEGSFYESFSDLIFCTLVLFIVIVMALVLKLGQAGGGGAGGEARVPTEQLEQALAAAEQLRSDLQDATRLAAQAEEEKAQAEAAAEQAAADAAKAIASAEAAAADATNELVFPNKFRGSTGQTYFNLVALPIENQMWVAWTDADINARWYLNRRGTRTTKGPDPVLEICQAVLDDEITMMPFEQFLLMAPGLGFENYDEHMVVNSAVASAVYLAWRFQGEVNGNSPAAAAKLRDLIGGSDFGTNAWYENFELNTKRLRADVLNAYRTQLAWSYGPNANDATYHHDLIDEKFRAVHPRANTAGNWVRFTATTNGVRVGNVVMTPRQLKNILRSYDPGGGFYVEYVDLAGNPADPPAWVMEQVLIPAGMNARIVNEAALR